MLSNTELHVFFCHSECFFLFLEYVVFFFVRRVTVELQ